MNVETQLLHTLATVGPVAVSVDATTWSNYQGGIIQYHCGGTNNHAVLIVGYDLTGKHFRELVQVQMCAQCAAVCSSPQKICC